MHLWESSLIHAPAQRLDMQSRGLSAISILSAVGSGQTRATGQEVHPSLRASELGCPRKSSECDGVVSRHKSPWPNIYVSSKKFRLPPQGFYQEPCPARGDALRSHRNLLALEIVQCPNWQGKPLQQLGYLPWRLVFSPPGPSVT